MAGKPRTDFLNTGSGDRRLFFKDTIGRLARALARRAERRVAPHRPLRPPGALPEVAFLAACTRCGDCMDVCPVSAIHKAGTSMGLAAGTPVIDPDIQPCVACEEIACAASCPTEALTVPEGGWESFSFGRIELDPNRCVAFDGVECGVCARSCPIGDRALALDTGGRPVIKPEGCVGCGVCVRACVTTPSSLAVHYGDNG